MGMTSEGFQRKLTAILSADVAGYSRLMGKDEEATVRRLTTYREMVATLIRKHQGRVVDSPGDNLLADFASVLDAVRCAVEIQEDLRTRNAELPDDHKMEFRIGVNLGDVVVEGERIYGDGVNIAARLESLAEAGGICISRTVYVNVENKLAYEYEYMGEQKVKNIAKPIQAYRVLSSPGDAGRRVIGAKGTTERKWLKPALLLAAAVVLGIAVAVAWRFYLPPLPRPTRVPSELPPKEKVAYPLPSKPSVAVLPFSNMSGDPEQEYFSDGLTEDIITGLSKVPKLLVIARNSVFIYKGKHVRVQQVGQELGVRYVLEGSVRKAGDRVRITAQLVDATTGHHLWAEKYDRDLKDIFELQDEITGKILLALQVKLTEGEQVLAWRKGTRNRKAYEKALQALESSRLMTKEGNREAQRLYQEAIVLDPGYTVAIVGSSYTHWMDVINGWSRSPSKSMEQAVRLAKKALAIDDSLADTHVLLGNIFLMKRQFKRAMAASEMAISLNPNGADVNALLGLMLRYLGRAEEAIEVLEKAMRLNPIPPAWYLYNLGDAYRLVEMHEKAVESFKEALNKDPNYLLAWIYLATTYSQMGREEEARDAAQAVLRLHRKFNVDRYARRLPYKDQDCIERIVDALRKAGLT
jgi:adenylate cyclase